MVDKAQNDTLLRQRQAGAELLREVLDLSERWDGKFPWLDLPPGLSIEVVDRAEDLILEWKGSGEYRAAPLVVVLCKMLMEAIDAS